MTRQTAFLRLGLVVMQLEDELEAPPVSFTLQREVGGNKTKSADRKLDAWKYLCAQFK